MAFFIAYLTTTYFGIDKELIARGLLGFNAVLTAIVFSGINKSDPFWRITGSILSTMVSVLFIKLKWLQLTFPFVIVLIIL